jgi:hypothetical protein
MRKGTMSFSDLTPFTGSRMDSKLGREIATAHMSKFIGNGGLIIAVDREQHITQDFWRGYLSFKQERLKQLRKLELHGFNEETAKNLALVMHDMRIKPHSVFFDGEDVNA